MQIRLPPPQIVIPSVFTKMLRVSALLALLVAKLALQVAVPHARIILFQVVPQEHLLARIALLVARFVPIILLVPAQNVSMLLII